MMLLNVWLLAVSCGVVAAFTDDDRFIKKYAMMKVYESCFGSEVVKEVRKEMKAATSKCAGLSSKLPHQHSHTQALIHNLATQLGSQPQESVQVHTAQLQPGLHSSGMTALHNSAMHTILMPQPDASVTNPPGSSAIDKVSPATSFDIGKLQQAILAGYNKHLAAAANPAQSQAYSSALHPQLPGSYGTRPYYPTQPVATPGPFYSPPQQYAAPSHLAYYQPSHAHGYYPSPVPYYTHHPQPQYFAHPGYYSQQRSSRDLNIRGQLETLAARMSGRVQNVTCIMQELGYLDANMEPDYEKMMDRIARLPVTEELQRDMMDGVKFCQQFSQCVPDEGKDKLAREMVRPMFFFRCYKHKKLEACILKDVRERYSAEEMAEENLTSNDMRSMRELQEDNMVYEFLYGDNNFETETLL